MYRLCTVLSRVKLKTPYYTSLHISESQRVSVKLSRRCDKEDFSFESFKSNERVV